MEWLGSVVLEQHGSEHEFGYDAELEKNFCVSGDCGD